MRYGLKDRIFDLVRNFCEKHNFKKENLLDILIAVGLSALIAFGIAIGVSPNTDAICADIDRLGQSDQDILGIIGVLDDQDAAALLALHGINTTVSGQVASINGLASLLNALRLDFNNLVCSPPDAHLEGAFGNYTLYVKSSTAGEFTANIHLVYAPPLSAGNVTNCAAAVDAFYAGINWTAANQLYIPTVAFNGTTWTINRVSFNIGTFTLEAYAENVIDIKCVGVPHIANYAYVEVYPVQ